MRAAKYFISLIGIAFCILLSVSMWLVTCQWGGCDTVLRGQFFFYIGLSLFFASLFLIVFYYWLRGPKEND